MCATSADTDTAFLTITAQNHNPRRAAAVANAFARGLGTYQTVQQLRGLNLQIASLRKQLAQIRQSNQGSVTSLTGQLAQLRAQRSSTGSGVTVLERALPSSTPVGPKTTRAIELALVIALLLGVGAVLVAENSDRRLRTPEDLEDLTGTPLLGVIPPTAFSPSSYSNPRQSEPFQMLRASLTYFNVDRSVSSVAIVSPLAEDGKTTVAVGLALACAGAGKRAVLIDADLRRPCVCDRLGIDSTADGLGAVLAGQLELAQALIDYPVEVEWGGSLKILPAGPPPPNPAALLGSRQMRSVLRELEDQSDLVVIDTAAALAVGDALPLLQDASGIVMIVRMNRSSAAAVRRLLKVIESTNGSVLGVVATGSSTGTGGYGDPNSYYAQTHRRGRLRSGRLRRRRAVRRKAAAAPSPVAPSPNGASQEPAAAVEPVRIGGREQSDEPSGNGVQA